MTVTIASIQDKSVRQAAEKADDNLNRTLDESEVSLFLTHIMKNNCNTSAVLQVLDQFTDFKSEKTQEMITKLEKINSLEKEIANKKKQLEINVAKRDKMPKSNTLRNSRAVGMTIGGAAGLTYAGYALMAATGPIGMLGAAALGLATALGTMWLGDKAGEYVGEKLETHEEKCTRVEYEEFEKTQVTTLIGEISELEEELEQLRKQFAE